MTFETLVNMWKISYLNAAFEFLKQVTTIFKQGAQRHALMRYALRWRAALDKVSLIMPVLTFTKRIPFAPERTYSTWAGAACIKSTVINFSSLCSAQIRTWSSTKMAIEVNGPSLLVPLNN